MGELKLEKRNTLELRKTLELKAEELEKLKTLQQKEVELNLEKRKTLELEEAELKEEKRKALELEEEELEKRKTLELKEEELKLEKRKTLELKEEELEKLQTLELKKEELKLKEEEQKKEWEKLALEQMGLKKSKEDLERLVRKVQDKPSHFSRVFGSLFSPCRRLVMPFSQVLSECRLPFGSLGRSLSWSNGWSLPSLRVPGLYIGEFCSSLSSIFSRGIFSYFQSLFNNIGKIVIIVFGISCASLVAFSWPAIHFFLRVHFMPLEIMFMNVRVARRLLFHVS